MDKSGLLVGILVSTFMFMVKDKSNKNNPPKPVEVLEKDAKPKMVEAQEKPEPVVSNPVDAGFIPKKTTWKEWFETGSHIATIAGVAIAGFVFWVTYRQVNKQIDLSRLQVQLSERAYVEVNIDSVKLEKFKPLPPNLPVQGDSQTEVGINNFISFKNIGKSPGWLVRSYVTFVFDKSNIREILLHGDFKEYVAYNKMTETQARPLIKDILSFPPGKLLEETYTRFGRIGGGQIKCDFNFEIQMYLIYRDVFNNYHDVYLRKSASIAPDTSIAMGYRIYSDRPIYDFYTFTENESKIVKALENE